MSDLLQRLATRQPSVPPDAPLIAQGLDFGGSPGFAWPAGGASTTIKTVTVPNGAVALGVVLTAGFTTVTIAGAQSGKQYGTMSGGGAPQRLLVAWSTNPDEEALITVVEGSGGAGGMVYVTAYFAPVVLPNMPVGLGGQARGNSLPVTLPTDLQGTAVNMALETSTLHFLVVLPGEWAVFHSPAVSARATISKAAGAAGVLHICTGFSFGFSAGVAIAAASKVITIRDGASGAGVVLRSYQYSLPAAIIAPVTVEVAGLHLVGSAATAMTIEFDALLANLLEFVNISGFDAA